MRFLCKKCRAQSPGELSEIAVRDGALVFTCKACGSSATLVENHDPGACGTPSSGKGGPAEKGIVEPDEDELVELGQATISRMLGRRVRIVDDTVPPAEPAPVGSIEPPAPPEPTLETSGPAPLVPEPSSSHGRFAVGVFAGLVLAAAVTFALLEARQPASSEGVHPPAAAPATPAGGEPAATPAAPRDVPRTQGAGMPERAAATRPAASPAPTRPAREEAPTITAARELRVEKAVPPSVHPGSGPPTDHVEETFRRIRPGVRMCALQERRRNADAKLEDEPVTVTFAPTGEALRVTFTSAGLEGTAFGGCLAVELKKTRLEPFLGEPVAVRRVLSLAVPGGSAN